MAQLPGKPPDTVQAAYAWVPRPKPPRDTVQAAYWLPRELRDKVRIAAAQQGTTQSALVARVLFAALATHL